MLDFYPQEAFSPSYSHSFTAQLLTAALQCSSLQKPYCKACRAQILAWLKVGLGQIPEKQQAHHRPFLVLKGWSHIKQLSSPKKSIPLWNGGHPGHHHTLGLLWTLHLLSLPRQCYGQMLPQVPRSASLCGSLWFTQPCSISGVSWSPELIQ